MAETGEIPTATKRPPEPKRTPPIEGEQTTEEQINALIDQLNGQNQEVGGMMMFQVPLTDMDKRPVYFFTPFGERGGPDQIIWGVHPGKGPIGVRGPLAENVVNIFKDGGIKGFSSRAEGLRYGNPNDFLVNNQTRFDYWTSAYNKAQESAGRFHQEEVAKRQWLPKVLEVVK